MKHGGRKLVLLEVELREQSALLDVTTPRVQHDLVHLQQIDHMNRYHDRIPNDLARALAVLHLQHHVRLVLVVALVSGVAPTAVQFQVLCSTSLNTK